MVRGTTAQFKFSLPYNYSDISLVKITFWQLGNNGPDETRPLPIIKDFSWCRACSNPKELSVTLTEEETLRFSDKSKAYVQLKAQSEDGSVFASKQEQITVYPVYDDNVLGDDIIPTPTEGEFDILDGGTI
jgi:hypothetical protein